MQFFCTNRQNLIKLYYILLYYDIIDINKSLILLYKEFGNYMDNKKNFFTTFLFLGIIAVLVGTILQLYIYNLIDNKLFQFIITILGSASITVGMGMIIGYIMDMTKNSDEYINYIQERLQDTIISRKFISDLSEESKHKIIEYCLVKKSTHNLLTEYVNYKSEKMSKLCDGHLRGSIDYTTIARKKD